MPTALEALTAAALQLSESDKSHLLERPILSLDLDPAELPELPGVLAYGQSSAEAISNAESVALRVLAANGDMILPSGIVR